MLDRSDAPAIAALVASPPRSECPAYLAGSGPLRRRVTVSPSLPNAFVFRGRAKRELVAVPFCSGVRFSLLIEHQNAVRIHLSA